MDPRRTSAHVLAVGSVTIFTVWLPVFPVANIRPKAETVTGDPPTVMLIPTHPLKLFRSAPQ